MAVYTGTLPSTGAVGNWITVLDATVAAHANWSIFDAAAGTNRKVYKATAVAGGFDIYIDFNDNVNVAYASLRACEGWDANTHAPIGNVTSVVYMGRGNDYTYKVIVQDDYFILLSYIPGSTTNGRSCFAGSIRSLDASKNMAMVVGGRSTTYPTKNALGGILDSASGYMFLLQDIDGSYNASVNYWASGGGSASYYCKDYEDYYQIVEPPITGVGTSSGGRCHGRAKNFMGTCSIVLSLSNGDLINIGGVNWVAVTDGQNTSLTKLE